MLALHRSIKNNEVVCLITIKSKNPDSYMFHTPNIDLTQLQAEKLNIPIITQETLGEKEKELDDLKQAIQFAKDKYQIEGVVTGAVESAYQSSRVQNICYDLNLYCFNPLWKADQESLLKEMIDKKFEIIISSIASYPFDESWIGKTICQEKLNKLKSIKEISITGEGGEYESTVLFTPLFSEKIKIKKSKIECKNHAGRLIIEEAE